MINISRTLLIFICFALTCPTNLFAEVLIAEDESWQFHPPEVYVMLPGSSENEATFQHREGLSRLVFHHQDTSNFTTYIEETASQYGLKEPFRYFVNGELGNAGFSTEPFVLEGETYYTMKLGIQAGNESFFIFGLASQSNWVSQRVFFASAFDSLTHSLSPYQAGAMTYFLRPSFMEENLVNDYLQTGQSGWTVDLEGWRLKESEELLAREVEMLIQEKEQNPAALQRFYRQNALPAVEGLKESAVNLKSVFKDKEIETSGQIQSLQQMYLSFNFVPQNSTQILYPPMQVLRDKIGDCDSKVLSMHVMLHLLGIESVILINLEGNGSQRNHAVLGVHKKYMPNYKVFKGDYVFIELLKEPVYQRYSDLTADTWVVFPVL